MAVAVIVIDVVPSELTNATVVPVAAAVALAGDKTAERGAVVKADAKVMVHEVTSVVPTVTWKLWSLPPAAIVPWVVEPHAFAAIVGVPAAPIRQWPFGSIAPAAAFPDEKPSPPDSR